MHSPAHLLSLPPLLAYVRSHLLRSALPLLAHSSTSLYTARHHVFGRRHSDPVRRSRRQLGLAAELEPVQAGAPRLHRRGRRHRLPHELREQRGGSERLAEIVYDGRR